MPREAIMVMPVPGRLRAAAGGDGAREDAALCVHRRARLRDPRRDASLRPDRARVGERSPAGGDRDRRARRVRRAHGRQPQAGRGADRPGRAKRCGAPSRWPTSSRSSARRPPGHCTSYYSAAMAKICAVCGKKPSFGHNRSHSMVATKRRFDPNLQRVRVLLDGRATRAYVCTKCLKAGKVEKAL